MTTLSTEIIERPDGSQLLVFPKLQLTVIDGPADDHPAVFEQDHIIIGSGVECDLQLADEAVSRRHLEIRASSRGWVLRDLGSTNGTTLGGVRLVEVIVTSPVKLQLGGTTLQVTLLADQVEVPLSPQPKFGALIGEGTAMRKIFAVLEQVAPQPTTVLLEGETGTGKEACAQAIHVASPRRDRPFIVVDCGAIPRALIESELFGHLRGAFTGADHDRAGALERAHQGTLFLDEISELDLELQPRLLRFLENQEVKRIGATQHQKVDVRVIAATNRGLSGAVQEQRFRKDLFYRLSVVRVQLPPLRHRAEDILPLAEQFARTFEADPDALFTPSIASLLNSHTWPGNLRELRNTVERLIVLPEQAKQGLTESGAAPDPEIGALINLPYHEARKRWVDLFERQYISAQLQRASGVVSWAADNAEIPRQTFHRLVRRHDLKKKSPA